jgi:Flp pilus assembly protein TadD
MSMSRLRNNNILSTKTTTALLIALAFPVSTAIAASGLQLKTDDREVYGTREIEAGEYAAGIAKLEIALQRAGPRMRKSPILNNLCVAYVATGELEKADIYCQMAVDTGYNQRLAYNNRGVMNYAAGDIEASIRDFDLSVKLGYGYGVATKNLALLKK